MSDFSDWLSVGARTEHPGALTVDIRPGVAMRTADVRALSFEANTFEGIELYHVLEHILPHDVPVMLSELRRVLKPGGTLECIVPDLVACAQQILAGNLGVIFGMYSPDPAPAQHHVWGYTPETLRQTLAQAGFTVTAMLPRHPGVFEIGYRAVK